MVGRGTNCILSRKLYVLSWFVVVSMYLHLYSKFSTLESTGEYNDNGIKSMREKVNYREVMMHPSEVDVVLKAIKGRKSYLEWGSGGTTINFPQFVSGKVVSIEHDQEWCKIMPARLAQNNIRKVDFYCIETIGQNGNEGTYATFKLYIDKINALNESTWDFVLIDGRARVAAAIRTLSYIRNDSAVIVHDFERIMSTGSDSYTRILDYYDVVDRTGNLVRMKTGGRGIARLHRKGKYGYLEGKHDQVQKILDLNLD